MIYNGVDFDTYFKNYPDENGYFGKYGGVYITEELKQAMEEITEAYFTICKSSKFISELRRMGANISVEGNAAFVTGVEGFTGARVSAPDLRAGAALVMAGLVAEGYTYVDDIQYIERGYENFAEKIRGLGGHMEKIDAEDERAVRKFKMKVS